MFRIMIRPGTDKGYEVNLTDYADGRGGTEKVGVFLVRRFTTAALQHAFADEFASFTGFDVESSKGEAMQWSEAARKYLTSKERSRVADRADDDDVTATGSV